MLLSPLILYLRLSAQAVRASPNYPKAFQNKKKHDIMIMLHNYSVTGDVM